MGTCEDKDALRARFRAVREGLGACERARVDAAICEHVVALDAFAQAETVLSYLSFGAEVDTRGIIGRAWQLGKRVCLPRCVSGTREMSWHVVESLDGLLRSPFGVEEPEDDDATRIDVAAAGPAIALVPGLTFDARGFRLGYGGGYYDAFLARFRGCSVGLCRTAQLSERLAALDGHDLPVQLVVTENGPLPADDRGSS